MAKSILTSTFLQLRDKLYSIAVGITGSGEDADDILHDVFCKLWINHRLLKNKKEVAKISIAAVHNSSIDRWRQLRSHPRVTQESIQDFLDVDENDAIREREELCDSLLRLSRRVLNDTQYKIFVLHDVENKSYDDIAETVGLTPVNVRKVLSRARKAIRDIYRNKLERE